MGFQIESLTDKAGKIDISGKHRKKKNSGSVQQEPAVSIMVLEVAMASMPDV